MYGESLGVHYNAHNTNKALLYIPPLGGVQIKYHPCALWKLSKKIGFKRDILSLSHQILAEWLTALKNSNKV